MVLIAGYIVIDIMLDNNIMRIKDLKVDVDKHEIRVIEGCVCSKSYLVDAVENEKVELKKEAKRVFPSLLYRGFF